MPDTSITMDYTAMRFWWDVLQTAILVAISVYVWIKSRSQVNTDRIAKVEKNLLEVDKKLVKAVGQEERIAQAESTLIEHDKRLSKAIGHDDLEDIHKRLGGISRELSGLKGEFKANSNLLNRIDHYIRTGGK